MITYNGSFGDTVAAWIWGRLERTSAPTFTIQPKSNNFRILLNRNFPTNITGQQIANAFNNFNSLTVTGPGASLVNLSDLTLPDGDYRICFLANRDQQCPPDQNASCNLSPFNAGCGNFTIACKPENGAQITTIVTPPVTAFIRQAIASQKIVANIQVPSLGCPTRQVSIYGKIERLSPSPFTVALNPSHFGKQIINITGPVTPISPQVQLEAFGNFQESALDISGISYRDLVDSANNIRLPAGTYRICYFAKWLNSQNFPETNASNPALGCATFTICGAATAPQFTQPVSNLNVSSTVNVIQPTSPVVFTWTPPLSTCGLPPGGYLYDFEIRELFTGQALTDAVNNPFVFQKSGLPTNTFIPDTVLYRSVLQQGKRYAIRVRAVGANTSSNVDIENRGFSRLEAFQYGEKQEITTVTPIGTIDPELAYLNFEERRSNYWDDEYNRLLAGSRSDTLVPLHEYIALKLMQEGTAYGLDAIELFLLTNPDLINQKFVRLSHKANVPAMPQLTPAQARNFAIKHSASLNTDVQEQARLRRYADSLQARASQQDIAAGLQSYLNELLPRLNDFNKQTTEVDKITLNTINSLVAEILFVVRSRKTNMSDGDIQHIRELVNDVMELTASTSNATAANTLPIPAKPLAYQVIYAVSNNTAIPLTNVNDVQDRVPYAAYMYALKDRILPFDVIVYISKAPPDGPIVSAPSLNAAYNVLYTPSSLYNNRNPEINAKSAPDLASITQVSLPQTLGYTFWTVNMINHKKTKPVTIEVKDVFLYNRKREVETKKPTIVLKVN